ncbi:hypothetical protein ACQ4PT_011932 [Festuca glaucescens]
MASTLGKKDTAGPGRGRRRRTSDEIPAWRKHPVELLRGSTAPPDCGGDYGGLGESPARPKPPGGVPTVPLLRWREGSRQVQAEEHDGNWDDGMEAGEEPGLRQGSEKQIGGIVDMEDDIYLEFDEDEEEVAAPIAPTTWKLLARYMANFKPSAKSMFDYFADEGDFDFVSRGGPWIFNKNALLVKKLDNEARPSETILDSVPIWVRMYDIPWGKQDEETGMKYGNGLGRALEVDVPTEEQDKHEFLRVRVELPYNRRLQTQITIGVKGKPWATKVYKLKYERVPYYCSHCGFM